MATPQDKIKEMASCLHERYLKALSFRKSANTWTRLTEWPHIINVQLSRWNSADEAQFTVNLGISIPELHSASEGLSLKGPLKEYDCDVRSRIGQLFSNQTDHWWKVTLVSDPDALADEVFARIEEFALPWFDRLVDFASVAAEFRDLNSPFMSALAFHLAGDSTSAEESIARAMKDSNPFFLSKLRRIAKAQGILIKG